MASARIMILAGEASGDAHAAEFVEALHRIDPQIRASAMGGEALRRAGADVFFDSSIIAVVGLIEVAKHWGDIKRAMAAVEQRLDRDRPDLLILVDYPEFNLKMARCARRLGIRVLFYVSPQVWAWRPKRIHKIGRLIDHMAVIFRFEQAWYERAGIPVTFVGHPLVDKVPSTVDAAAARARLGIAAGRRIVGLFPGSRQSEVARLLPLLLEVATRLRAREPELEFVLPVASTLDADDIERRCRDAGLGIRVSRDDIYDLIGACDVIATCSGTVTLEIALLGTPMCILYRMSALSYAIMRRLITIPHIGLANIVAGGAVVREFLQRDATPGAVADELFRLLDDTDYRREVVAGLARVRDNLGEGQGAENMARLVISLLEK